MSNAKRILSVGAVLAALVATTFAATNVVGSWTGRVSVDTSKLPQQSDPLAQKQMKTMRDMMAKVVLHVKLKADKTYTATTTGVPGGKEQKEAGTWSISGSTVTIKTTTSNGKPATGQAAKAQKLALSKDGKTMTETQSSPAPGGTIIFTIVLKRN